MLILQILGSVLLIVVMLLIIYAIVEPSQANGYGYSDDISK